MASSVFDLFARLTLDSRDFDNQLRGTESQFGAFGNKLKSFAGTAIKVTSAAVAAGAGVVAAITKSAISSYADYEQLVGGVETLFKDSAARVIENSQNAYRTAGMSANEYMETVTGFSASLLQSLEGDTKAAADMADLAVQDMSDNANKMGTDIGRITDAYQGFAKQNYTMLDNLKLGYGGTKTEMERLVADAEKLDSSFKATRDENGKLTLSFSDVVQAIHIVQDEMGITGTTAKEASTTISGSISSMKAAWQNLLTGIADDNANFTQLVDNFINTLVGEGGQGGVINNLIPRIQQTLQGITKLITAASEQLLPIIVSTIITNLPALIQAGLQIVTTLSGAIIDNLPALIDASIQIIQTITSTIVTPDNLVALIDAGLQIILALADALIDSLPSLIPAVIDIILTIVEKLTDPETIVKLQQASLEIIIAIAKGLIAALPRLVEAVLKIGSNIVEVFLRNKQQYQKAGEQALAYIKAGLVSKAKDLYDKAKTVANNVKTTFTKAWESAKTWGSNLISKISSGVSEKTNSLTDSVRKIGENVGNYFKRFSESCKTYGSAILVSLASGIVSKVSDVYDVYKRIIDSIMNSVRQVIDAAKSWGSGLMTSFINGMVEKFNSLVDKLRQVGQAVKSYLHFTQPDKGPLSGPNGFESYAPDMMKTFAKGITDNTNLVTNAISKSFDFGDQMSGFSSGTVVSRGPAQNIGGSVREMTTILQLDRQTLGRVVYELYNEEQQRVGLRLAGGTI